MLSPADLGGVPLAKHCSTNNMYCCRRVYCTDKMLLLNCITITALTPALRGAEKRLPRKKTHEEAGHERKRVQVCIKISRPRDILA